MHWHVLLPERYMMKNLQVEFIQKEKYKMKWNEKPKQQKNKNNGVLYEAIVNIKRSYSRSIICEWICNLLLILVYLIIDCHKWTV